MSRVSVYLTPQERADVARRARLHRMSLSAFLRTAGLAGNSRDSRIPDDWWNSLSPTAKQGFYEWHNRVRTRGTRTEHDQPLPLEEEQAS